MTHRETNAAARGVREARPEDADRWLEMRLALWPECPEAQHRVEMDRVRRGGSQTYPLAVLIVEDGVEGAVGFAELSVRPFAEGCLGERVAYLEGWFVEPDRRRQGLGRGLVAAAEAWARAVGCCEFASDADPENTRSHAAHRALGFADAGLVRCLRKDL